MMNQILTFVLYIHTNYATRSVNTTLQVHFYQDLNTLNYFQLFAGRIKKKDIYLVPTQKAHKIAEVINLQRADDAKIYSI